MVSEGRGKGKGAGSRGQEILARKRFKPGASSASPGTTNLQAAAPTTKHRQSTVLGYEKGTAKK